MKKCCFQWFKDTNLKANHNKRRRSKHREFAVFNGSKILKLAHIRITFEEIVQSV